jgi:hypothetical protein
VDAVRRALITPYIDYRVRMADHLSRTSNGKEFSQRLLTDDYKNNTHLMDE